MDDELLLKGAEVTVTAFQDFNHFENVSNNNDFDAVQGNIPGSKDAAVNEDNIHDNHSVVLNKNDIHDNQDVVVNEDDIHDNEDAVVNKDDIHDNEDAVVNEDHIHGSQDIFLINDILPDNQNDDETDMDNTTDIQASDKGKRRKRPNSSRWTRILNKDKRERGEEYVGIKKTGDKWQYDIIKPAKKMKPHCNCSMSNKSTKINCNLFTETCRQELFNTFWKQMNWEQRRTHIQAMVDSDRTKDLKNQQNDVSRRNSSLFYHLKHKGQRLRVCKTLFTNTYCITDWVILNYLKKPKDLVTEEDMNCTESAKRKKKRYQH